MENSYWSIPISMSTLLPSATLLLPKCARREVKKRQQNPSTKAPILAPPSSRRKARETPNSHSPTPTSISNIPSPKKRLLPTCLYPPHILLDLSEFLESTLIHRPKAFTPAPPSTATLLIPKYARSDVKEMQHSPSSAPQSIPVVLLLATFLSPI